MYKIFYVTIFLIAFLLASCAHAPQTKKTSHRVISLAPSITEMIFALGAGDKIVAVSDYCLFPPEAQKKEKVGGLFNPNLEKIMALKPDLILGTSSYGSLKEKLSAISAHVVLLPEKSIDDIFFGLDSLGVLLGKQRAADSLKTAIRDSLQKYRGDFPGRKPRVMLVLGRDPGAARNVGVSGPGAFINELLDWCGAENAFSDLKVSYSTVGRESILVRDPDIIIEFRPSPLTKDQLLENREQWKSFKQVSAYRDKRIYVIAGNNYLIPGPRVYRLAHRLYDILHAAN